MRSHIIISLVFTLTATPALAITAQSEKDPHAIASVSAKSTSKQTDTAKATAKTSLTPPKNTVVNKPTAVQQPDIKNAEVKKPIAVQKPVVKSVEVKKPIGAVAGFFGGVGFAVSNAFTFNPAKKAEKESIQAEKLIDSAEARIQMGDEKGKIKAEKELKKANELVETAHQHIEDAKIKGDERAEDVAKVVASVSDRVQIVSDVSSKRGSEKKESAPKKNTVTKIEAEKVIPEPTVEELENVTVELKKVIDDPRYPPEFTSFLQNVHKNVETRVSERKAEKQKTPR